MGAVYVLCRRISDGRSVLCFLFAESQDSDTSLPIPCKTDMPHSSTDDDGAHTPEEVSYERHTWRHNVVKPTRHRQVLLLYSCMQHPQHLRPEDRGFHR